MKKVKTILRSLVLMGLMGISFYGCKKAATVVIPTVSTESITGITQLSATGGGIITSDGGAMVTFRGVCWSTSPVPTILDNKTVDGTGIGTFFSSITRLNGGTQYYVCAYATNSVGTAYGTVMPFITGQTVVTTAAATNVSFTSATCGGSVISNGGETITAQGICWSTSTNPTTANSKTSDSVGTASFTNNITGLAFSTTYYVRAYVVNSAGTTYGSTVSFTTLKPALTDVDGNGYNVVTIGTQIWMASNLQTTKYNDGTTIPNVTDDATWAGLSTGVQCTYNNIINTDSITLYGRLYNGYAVATGKLCPTGWHIPTDAEWTTLENYLIANGYNYDGSTTGDYIAKSMATTTGWNSDPTTGDIGNNPSTNNKSGFSAFPSGIRNAYGTFSYFGRGVAWWSSMANDYWSMNSYLSKLYYYYYNESYGYSVRCVKN